MKRTPLRRKSKTPLAKVKQRLWEECRRIIRERHGYTCYTCSKATTAPHTGHYIPSSVCSVEMRYNLDNLRPQCYHCNINLSGNWISYEKRLREDMGKSFPEKLKKMNEDTKGKQYDILWYENKLEEYKTV